MLIENALSDAVRFFHMDALSSAVGMKVDFDMTLLVIASGLYRLLARRMRGYADAQARHIFRDLIDTPADVSVTDDEVAGPLPPPRTLANRPGIRSTQHPGLRALVAGLFAAYVGVDGASSGSRSC